jgi:hypothetical protein
MQSIRKRLTYANVMSSIAVFLVLGGAAFAASQLPKNSVGTKQLKKNSVTTAKIKNGAVTGSKVNSSTLGKVPSASNADLAVNAGNANSLGGVPPTSYQRTSGISFATIAPATASATVVRGRGVTGVTQIATGYFAVTFNRDVSECTWLATYGAPNFTGIEGYYTSLKGGPEPNEVRVVIWDASGTQVNGLGFHVEALCP